MTHIEQAINEAVEKGGWCGQRHKYDVGIAEPQLQFNESGTITLLGDGNHDRTLTLYEILYQPSFWQALGKARNWMSGDWKAEWHRFIDRLAEGKDAESFFSGLN